MLSGILTLNKPVGVKSTSCVNIVKQILGKHVRVGHAGTLDAPASGLLLLMVGSATRLSRYLMELPKIYEVSVVLGCSTDTDDYSGCIIGNHKVGPQAEILEQLSSVILSFQGTRMQTPPDISAVKVDGERAHRLFRQGKKIDIKPRPVFVSRIEPINPMDYFDLSFRVFCHKGTYIRSIVRDIGNILGCGAFVSSLTRVETGPFSIRSEKCVQNVGLMDCNSIIPYIQPIDAFIKSFTTYRIPTQITLDYIEHGRPVLLRELKRSGWGTVPSSFAVGLLGKNLLSMGSIFAESGQLYVKPTTNIFLDGEIR